MPKPSERGACITGALLLTLSLASAAQSPPTPATPATPAAPAAPADPSGLPAEVLPRAAQSLLLDAVQTPAGFFVAGERGHVLTSADGRSWTQQKVPTRSTLTTLATADGQLWAAGHDGVILHSADGGQTWHPQRRDPYALEAGQHPADRDQKQGAPVLDLVFTDASNGIAIGAYSLMLRTTDGGATWSPVQALPDVADAAPEPVAVASESGVFDAEDLELGEESNPHFNAIARTGSGALALVGERGTFLRSRDGGATWQKLAFPYGGSLFGVLAWEGDHILAFGLRGNVYESADLGSTWTKVESGVGYSLMGGTALAGGGAVLVGTNGTVLVRADGAAPFATVTHRNAAGETPALAAVIPAGAAGYLLAGEKGVDTYLPK